MDGLHENSMDGLDERLATWLILQQAHVGVYCATLVMHFLVQLMWHRATVPPCLPNDSLDKRGVTKTNEHLGWGHLA